MLVLDRREVAGLLGLAECIDAVERAFVAHARGELPAPPGVLGTHVAGGGFHVKAATLPTGLYAAKINANFPSNPRDRALPAIQGLIVLFDLASGRPLAVLDSIEITMLRTAAASALAARHLARADASVATIAGCGSQGRSHLRALRLVRPLEQVFAYDLDPACARRFADELGRELGIAVEPVTDLVAAVAASDLCVTCTPARQPIVTPDMLHPGLFIAAVGADSPEKQELAPAALARARLVVDLIDQAAAIGELHHAIAAGVLSLADVHAELGEIAAGLRPGRVTADEMFVFDSTGTAIQDVAAAAVVYERAQLAGVGRAIAING